VLLAAAPLMMSVAVVSAPAARAATSAQWEQWQHIPGVFDVAGPRSDGRLVIAAHKTLSLMTLAGQQSAYAPGYSAPDGSESYIALSPGLTVSGSGCSFARDDLYALDLTASTPGVTRVSSAGAVSHLASVSGASSLGGITFDTVGRFGYRLLAIGGVANGSTGVFAIDCNGAVTHIATVATALEGGIAVAPPTFGAYGGQLIAPNELDGRVYAVSASGVLSTITESGVPAGQDTGVESIGFVPPTGAGVAYMADRVTAGNPHPGTDSLLRLRLAALSPAGVAAGDALVGTEGGATVVDIRCAANCSATVVAHGPSVSHGEGKIIVIAAANPTTPAPLAPAKTSGPPTVVWLFVGLGALLTVAVGTVLIVRRRLP
jgi:hypothetical protein